MLRVPTKGVTMQSIITREKYVAVTYKVTATACDHILIARQLCQ
jgi:hypothetical protein